MIGPAPPMTALDMKGFWLSLLPLDDQGREALMAPVGARAWPAGNRAGPFETLPLPDRLRTEADGAAPALAGGAEAAPAAEAGAARTAGIGETRSGRSSYINAADLRGTPDPGAVAVAILMSSLA